jgi:hypothetical protein
MPLSGDNAFTAHRHMQFMCMISIPHASLRAVRMIRFAISSLQAESISSCNMWSGGTGPLVLLDATPCHSMSKAV